MMVTNSEINTTNPIGIVSGGTNTASFSHTNGTVYFDGTKLSSTTTGTSGYALTSNGGSSAPTYQALPSSAGAWNLIQTLTASTSGNLIFSTSTYSNYAVIFNGIVPDTASQTFSMLWSTDGGSTYLSSYNSGYYSYPIYTGIATIIQSSSSTNTYCYVSAPGVATSGIPLSGTMFLMSMTQNAATYYPAYYADVGHPTSSALNWTTGFGKTTSDTQGITNISFQFTSGNILSGSISLFGISS